MKTDLCNTLQQCVDEWHLGSSSAWHPSSRLSPGPPGPSHCVLQYPADVGSDWGDADQPDYSLHRTIWRESDTRRLTLTLLFRGLRGSCVVIRSGAENVRWRLNTERRNAARTSRLYDNSVLTTAAVWSTLILWGSLSLCFWHLDFRGGGGCGWWHHEVRTVTSPEPFWRAERVSTRSDQSGRSKKTDRWAAARSRWQMWHARIKLEQKGKLISCSERSQSSVFSGSAGV